MIALAVYSRLVTREEVWKHVSGALRDDFGKLLDVRDVRRVRRVAGDAWLVTVVLASASGDLHIADLTVDASGAISPTLGPDHVGDPVRRAQRPPPRASPPDELADFGSGATDDDEPALDMLS